MARNSQRIVADNSSFAIEQLGESLDQGVSVSSEIVIGGMVFPTLYFLEQAARNMRGPVPARWRTLIGLDAEATMVEALKNLEGRLKQRGLI